MIDGILLQACGIEGWLAGDWHTCVFTPVTGLVGEGVFGLFIGVGIWVSLYFAGGRSTTATAVTILVATVLFPTLPGQFRAIAWSVLFVGGVAAIIQPFQKYLLNPSTA